MSPQRPVRQAIAAEGAATFLLVLGGLSCVCLVTGEGSPVAASLPSGTVRLALTGAAFSAVNSLLAASPLGHVSGAHLNPAVTLVFRVLGRIDPGEAAGYVAAQLAGAVSGAAVLRAAWGGVARSIDGGATVPAVGAPEALALEAALTAILVAVVLVLVSSRRLARRTPLALWPVIALLVLGGGRATGASLNPARSAGPALVFGALGPLWLYLAGPTAGALAVALAWRAFGPVPVTAMLCNARGPRETTHRARPRGSGGIPGFPFRGGRRDRDAEPRHRGEAPAGARARP